MQPFTRFYSLVFCWRFSGTLFRIRTEITNATLDQFTGRENDGLGLYFYRARYYSPTFQRFIAQDPIGFAGGDTNLYAYGLNDPISETDPLGLKINECKNGDCPAAPPADNPDWRPDANTWWWARLPRQYHTHPGQKCFEMAVGGRYLHCCYNKNGQPVYGPGGSAWEDWDPNNPLQWPFHFWEWLNYQPTPVGK